MAETLRDLLGLSPTTNKSELAYLEHLAEQTVDVLLSSEPQHLAETSHSLLRSVQSLSRRSNKLVVESAVGHASLREKLPGIAARCSELRQSVPRLDAESECFATDYSKASDNEVIASRRNAMRLLNNSERLVNLMELPPLLLSAVHASPLGYSSTMDLHSHVRRIATLYPNSQLVISVLSEADNAIRQIAVDLLTSLTASGLKLAAALRAVGWLRRIIPEIISDLPADNVIQTIFLVCRFSNFIETLEALDPLRKLAEEERIGLTKSAKARPSGQQTERYLKRFIEVFREHIFGIISISSNISGSLDNEAQQANDGLSFTQPALATFPLHLVGILVDTLQIYLPIVKEQTSRESILTQVLYCAGSAGRLGADFSVILSTIGVDEWVHVVKRHRMLAGRLESVIGAQAHAISIGTSSPQSV